MKNALIIILQTTLSSSKMHIGSGEELSRRYVAFTDCEYDTSNAVKIHTLSRGFYLYCPFISQYL
jgi:hypothetical protein